MQALTSLCINLWGVDMGMRSAMSAFCLRELFGWLTLVADMGAGCCEG